MANNAILFNAVVSGVFSGINTSRSLASAVGADYAAQVTNATAFATLLDAEIVAGAYAQSDADLLGGIVQQVVSGKGSAGLNMTSVNAIIAAFNAARAAMTPGAGDTGLPIDTALIAWADTLVEAAQQNGTWGAPYSTAQAAHNALPEEGTILIARSSVGTLGNLVTTKSIGLRGFGPTLAGQQCSFDDDINAGADLGVSDLFIAGTLTMTAGDLWLVGVNCQAIVSPENVEALNCESLAGSADIFDIFNCSNLGSLTSRLATIESSSLDSGTYIITDDLRMNDCNGIGTFTVGADCHIKNCAFQAGTTFNITDNLFIDTTSYAIAIDNGVTFTVGAAIQFTDQPISATVSIAVPNVVAGDVQYVDTSLVGTALEGLLQTNDPVLVQSQADLVAAGPGGGLLAARMSANDTLRCTFLGPVPLGAVDFTVSYMR